MSLFEGEKNEAERGCRYVHRTVNGAEQVAHICNPDDPTAPQVGCTNHTYYDEAGNSRDQWECRSVNDSGYGELYTELAVRTVLVVGALAAAIYLAMRAGRK